MSKSILFQMFLFGGKACFTLHLLQKYQKSRFWYRLTPAEDNIYYFVFYLWICAHVVGVVGGMARWRLGNNCIPQSFHFRHDRDNISERRGPEKKHTPFTYFPSKSAGFLSPPMGPSCSKIAPRCSKTTPRGFQEAPKLHLESLS